DAHMSWAGRPRGLIWPLSRATGWLAFRRLVQRGVVLRRRGSATLDRYRVELFRRDPRIVGELAVDLVLVLCVHDQQHADAPVFGSGERSGEEDEAAVCEGVHEGCVLVHRRLLINPSVAPAGSRFQPPSRTLPC